MPFQEIKGDDFCIQLMVWVFSLFEILPWMLAIIHQPFIDCQTQKSPTSVDLPGKSNKIWNFSLSFLRRHGVSCKLPFFGVWVNPHDGIHDSPLTFFIGSYHGMAGTSCTSVATLRTKRHKNRDRFFSTFVGGDNFPDNSAIVTFLGWWKRGLFRWWSDLPLRDQKVAACITWFMTSPWNSARCQFENVNFLSFWMIGGS